MTIKDHTLIRSGRILAATSVVVAVVSMGTMGVLGSLELMFEFGVVHTGLLAVGFGSLVWVKITTEARNGAVWAFAWDSFFSALFAASFAVIVAWGAYSVPDFTIDVASALTPAEVPLYVGIAMQTAGWVWLPAFFIVITFGLLLFPDGKPPSPKWRWVGWYTLTTMVLTAGFTVFVIRPSSTLPVLGTVNPEDLDARTAQLVGISGTLDSLVMLGAVFSISALIVRYRRSARVVQRQIRWIGWGTTLLFAGIVWTFVTDGTSLGGTAAPVALAVEALMILSFAVAITKYRLYDIDIVISKTVAFVSLAVVIAVLYVAAVFGLVALFGDPNQRVVDLGPGYWFGATALVAIVFEPLRIRLQRVADRVAYGKRATPHEILARLTSELSDSSSGEGLFGLAELLRDGTGSESAFVWLRVGDRLRAEAASPAVVQPRTPDVGGEEELPASDLELSVPVRHGGEVLGALGITKPRAHPVTPADENLLSDIAAGAGLLLRNLRLNAELAARAVQLQASRRRLITAQDAARHRLERDLHDGAQQQVVALKVRLSLAKAIAEREGATDVAVRVADLADATQQAVDAMRAVARGIYPPLLDVEGLGPALTTAHRSVELPIQVELGTLPRYSKEVEETAYFCVLAVANRAKMAGATSARIEVRGDDASLAVTATYDSADRGDLTVLTDRVEAFGGTVTIAATTEGTTLTLILPIDAEVMEQV